jgi:hypothetical protein
MAGSSRATVGVSDPSFSAVLRRAYFVVHKLFNGSTRALWPALHRINLLAR